MSIFSHCSFFILILMLRVILHATLHHPLTPNFQQYPHIYSILNSNYYHSKIGVCTYLIVYLISALSKWHSKKHQSN